MAPKAFIFDIKRDASEDGPGIRTTIFFKGCRLACAWCQNPEGLARTPTLSVAIESCRPDRCGRHCMALCPAGVFRLSDGLLRLDRSRCTYCGDCVAACPERALELIGQWYSVDELYYRLAIDKPFFRSSGGGVTASGGECTMQMPFLHEFFQRLRAADIPTAIETNGVFNFPRFRRLLLPWLDLVYFDLKLIDDAASRRYIGIGSRAILTNLLQLIQAATIPVIVRIPLIPGITDTDENLKGLARFLREHAIMSAELLPYNPLWQDKLSRFGLTAHYGRRAFMTSEELQSAIDRFHALR